MKNYTTPEANLITLTTADVISASSSVSVSCNGVANVGWGDFESNSYVDNNSGFNF
ncbi:MAG: hypothetical protein IJV72_00210 [Clostridia bacterium]|nr:hypothetical protein [Clostridia bacterium]